MKRFLFTCTMLWLMSHTLWAQTEAGKKLIGGQVLLHGSFSEDENRPKWFEYALSSYYGYFIKENFTIGAGISFSKQRAEYEIAGIENIYQDLSVFAASRYYIPIGEAKKFYAYLQGSLEFSWNKDEYGSSSQKIVIREYILAISPGLVYFPSPQWGLELGFSGLSSKIVDRKGRENYTSVTLGTDSFAPSLGVSYYF